jgi:hypothetical protein
MELVNHTPFPARLLSLEREDEQVQVTIFLKATYEQEAGGRLRAAEEQVPIVADKLETPFGIFHTDHYVRKEGADVCVLGSIRRSRPVTETVLALEVGAHRSELAVFGDRHWVSDGRGLKPSLPLPFTEMPLSYSRAFGGKAEFNYEVVTWADNPEGQGYFFTQDQAEGKPLPNIELSQGPRVKAWSDQVPVAGWGPYPMFWGLRAREGIQVQGSSDALDLPRLRARLNNHAHPELILPALATGDEIGVTGMRDEPLRVSVPLEKAVVEARIGETTRRVTGEPDGVFLWVDAGRVTVTHRVHFTYVFRREEVRQAHLLMEGRPAATRGGGGDARGRV